MRNGLLIFLMALLAACQTTPSKPAFSAKQVALLTEQGFKPVGENYELGIADRVLFTGQVTGDCKFSLYRNADAFVLPTSQENFGLVLIEAMACGVPVVTTKGVDIWRDLESSGSARIVDQDAAAIAATLKDLLSDRAALAAMGEAARPWVMRTYAEELLIGRYEQLYRTVALTGRGRKTAPQGELALQMG